jgi:putative two-component system response regulator
MMSHVLIIEDSPLLCRIIKELMEKYTDFSFDIANSYAEAEAYLEKYAYDYAIADLHLPDGENGKVIPLCNRHDIAPVIFTGDMSEELRETFESAQIVDYVLKERYDNIVYVVEKLVQLEANRKKTVLIVEDSLTYRYYLRENLKIHQFNIIEAANGEEALRKLQEHPETEMVITDYHMPVMDGLEFTRKARAKRTKKDLAILVLTTETNSYTTSKFLKSGANDYVTKPFSRDEFYARIYQNIEELSLFEEMRKTFEEDIIYLLCELTEYRSTETGTHIRRIRAYTYHLALACGLYEEEAALIADIAQLHDIGKISVPDNILSKPGKLTEEEFNNMKRHTEAGRVFVEDAFKHDPKIRQLASEIVYSHHEKYDGTGYPLGLKSHDIPFNARLVALCDCFDALITPRVYKEPWSMEEAFHYIKSQASKAFDPSIVKNFLRHQETFEEIAKNHF